jgi:hypothetical protein
VEKSNYYTGCDVPDAKLRCASGKIIVSDEQDSLVRIKGVEGCLTATDGSKRLRKNKIQASSPELQRNRSKDRNGNSRVRKRNNKNDRNCNTVLSSLSDSARKFDLCFKLI